MFPGPVVSPGLWTSQGWTSPRGLYGVVKLDSENNKLFTILPQRLADLAIKDSLNILTCWKSLDDFNRIFWCGQSKLAG